MIIALFIIYLVVTTVLNGWAMSILWDWFIVDTFDAPSLDIAVAVGIALTLRFMLGSESDRSVKKDEVTGKLVGGLAAPFVVLFFGWTVHSFV